MKIAVILGSTRPGRKGEAVARWVLAKAEERPDADYELIDLLDHPLPHLDEAVSASRGGYANDHTKAWSATIAEFDGFVFVTPEYNHSTSGVLKNAIDYLYAEWNNKAAAFVSYAHVRQQLSFSLFTDFENFAEFTPSPMHDGAASVLFDQLESWAGALKAVR